VSDKFPRVRFALRYDVFRADEVGQFRAKRCVFDSWNSHLCRSSLHFGRLSKKVTAHGSLFVGNWLRRSKPIEPLRVATVGGLGAAGLAAFALQFLHPFDVTMMDLTIHAVAVGVVIWLLTWRRSWAFGA
jgi:hypothetical protein